MATNRYILTELILHAACEIHLERQKYIELELIKKKEKHDKSNMKYALIQFNFDSYSKNMYCYTSVLNY